MKTIKEGLENNQEIVLYQSSDGEVSFNVNVFDETVWLTQKQMAELFDKHKMTINEHIANILKEGEAQESEVVRKFLTTASDTPNRIIC